MRNCKVIGNYWNCADEIMLLENKKNYKWNSKQVVRKVNF